MTTSQDYPALFDLLVSGKTAIGYDHEGKSMSVVHMYSHDDLIIVGHYVMGKDLPTFTGICQRMDLEWFEAPKSTFK